MHCRQVRFIQPSHLTNWRAALLNGEYTSVKRLATVTPFRQTPNSAPRRLGSDKDKLLRWGIRAFRWILEWREVYKNAG